MADAGERSEDVLGHKWDRCLSDTLIKTGYGVGLGVVFSVIFFKRRPWPVALGVGMGLGMGIANCQNDFQHPYLQRGRLVQKEEATQTPAVNGS